MRAALIAIISAFIFGLILIPMYMIFDNVVTPLDKFTNETDVVDAAGKSAIHEFYNFIRNVFTVIFLISLCGIPIGYFLDRLTEDDYRRDYRG